ncbi:type II secretion system protein [uncultured Clostridium sp.]|uniref:type II secretion system protein n=1 Tax=uncultured Clostridium sp. TaxID=59620 RepID=UPI0025DE9303|nr:prepilin-type N-terminal cleavage/methylation domain-containing protein [uncultured Clostridium sp.]
MNNLNKKRKKKGFTLVELMAVVAIIAILAVVLVPTVSGYINRSKKVAVISQVRIAVSAIETHNATASKASDVVGNDDKMKDLIATSGKLANEETLKAEDVDRIKEMSYGQAKTINKDGDAIKKIELESNGDFKSYK